ncbi:MSHA biogenesis protein MshK [Oxalobacteraceae bacterium OTU3REALA1]|nr:MSHA biogenesis protein MshK [Oxalobacteraceae bacterium OTU3REALA1]
MSAAMRHAWLAGALWALVLAALPAQAQTLSDPTQPPPESRLLAPGGSDAPVISAGPRLQSILIGTRGREVAVIDGQTLRKGDKLNGAVLVKISKNQVVLQHGREKQVLTLFPDTGTGGKTPVHQR